MPPPRTAIILLSLLASLGSLAQPLEKGSQAPAIVLPGVNALDTVSLLAFAGKVVLVDFWASWCGPCRISNRTQVGLYNKYHEQGFEILAVSMEQDTARWKRAIAEDGMPWPQAIDRKGWSSKLVAEWEVRKLPACYLLDKEGRIMAVNPNYGVIEAWLKELL